MQGSLGRMTIIGLIPSKAEVTMVQVIDVYSEGLGLVLFFLAYSPWTGDTRHMKKKLIKNKEINIHLNLKVKKKNL